MFRRVSRRCCEDLGWGLREDLWPGDTALCQGDTEPTPAPHLLPLVPGEGLVLMLMLVAYKEPGALWVASLSMCPCHSWCHLIWSLTSTNHGHPLIPSGQQKSNPSPASCSEPDLRRAGRAWPESSGSHQDTASVRVTQRREELKPGEVACSSREVPPCCGYHPSSGGEL